MSFFTIMANKISIIYLKGAKRRRSVKGRRRLLVERTNVNHEWWVTAPWSVNKFGVRQIIRRIPCLRFRAAECNGIERRNTFVIGAKMFKKLQSFVTKVHCKVYASEAQGNVRQMLKAIYSLSLSWKLNCQENFFSFFKLKNHGHFEVFIKKKSTVNCEA